MIDLPRRQATITVDLGDKDYPDLRIEMKALQDTEAARLMTSKVHTNVTDLKDHGEVAIEMPQEEMVRLFKKKFVRFVGEEVRIDGDPFKIENADHLASLPLNWKTKAMQALLNHASGSRKEVEEALGNSQGRSAQPPAASE